MNTKISESICTVGQKVIPMADVQHIEKYEYGCLVITKHTKWNMEHDVWENPINLNKDETKKFLEAWCYYRYELDIKEDKTNG